MSVGAFGMPWPASDDVSSPVPLGLFQLSRVRKAAISFLQGFQLPDDGASRDDEGEMAFVQAAEPVGERLNAYPLEEIIEVDSSPHDLQLDPVVLIGLAEMVEGAAREKMNMTGMAVRLAPRQIGFFHHDGPARLGDPVELFNCGNHVLQMLQAMPDQDEVEGIVRHGLGQSVQVVLDIGQAIAPDVDPHRSGELLRATADVQDLCAQKPLLEPAVVVISARTTCHEDDVGAERLCDQDKSPPECSSPANTIVTPVSSTPV